MFPVLQTTSSTRAESRVRELREQLLKLSLSYQQAETQKLHLTTDMARQYKDMREKLVGNIHTLKDEIDGLKHKLASARADVKEMEHKKNIEIDLKNAEIVEQKKMISRMAEDVALLLKQTLDKMGENIVVSGTEYAADHPNKGPVVDMFTPFNLAK
jgi:predicted RNase H-like nuclease (RuvC/YqgF family)